MASNPTSTLEATLEKRGRCFPDDPVLLVHPYNFSSNPPPCVKVNLERHLRYIKYRPFEGIDSFATIQEFQNREDAYRHWETQKSYDSKFVIHPQACVKHQDKYVLIFPKIFRDFNGCWINEHANGQVTDTDMWEILKKIGKSLRYLSTEAESNRPHGNLRDGIGITSDLEALLLNLGGVKHALRYHEDVKTLHGFLKSIEPRLRTVAIRENVQRWKEFLWTSCLQLTPDSNPKETSDIHPIYLNPNHVRLVLNYPSSWDVKIKLQFLSNMHKLCTDKCKQKPANLMSNIKFSAHLNSCHSNWNNRFNTVKPTALNEVYQFGVKDGNYLDRGTGILNVSTIVIFAHNCVKHYFERVQNYNNINYPRRTLISHTASEILAQIDDEFPHLIENIYRAFHLALADGYTHPNFSVEQIFTQVL